jgi:hypothetical protein
MPKLSVPLVAALALAGLSLGEMPSASAELPGIVNISDAQSEPITEAAELPAPGEEVGSYDDSLGDMSAYNGGMAYPGGWGAPTLPNGGAMIRKGKDWYGYTDNGPWMRPIRRPLYRVPVQYARYWPTSYYTGGYDPALRYSQPLPMVYQPTDTTQLGFYHQRVPQWQPRPGAIPGPPWPPQWHYAIPTRFGTFEGGSSWYGSGYGYGDPYGYGDGSGYPQEVQAAPINPPAAIDHGQDPQQATPAAPLPLPAEQES